MSPFVLHLILLLSGKNNWEIKETSIVHFSSVISAKAHLTNEFMWIVSIFLSVDVLCCWFIYMINSISCVCTGVCFTVINLCACVWLQRGRMLAISCEYVWQMLCEYYTHPCRHAKSLLSFPHLHRALHLDTSVYPSKRACLLSKSDTPAGAQS